jgi:hypothetical protein
MLVSPSLDRLIFLLAISRALIKYQSGDYHDAWMNATFGGFES